MDGGGSTRSAIEPAGARGRHGNSGLAAESTQQALIARKASAGPMVNR